MKEIEVKTNLNAESVEQQLNPYTPYFPLFVKGVAKKHYVEGTTTTIYYRTKVRVLRDGVWYVNFCSMMVDMGSKKRKSQRIEEDLAAFFKTCYRHQYLFARTSSMLLLVKDELQISEEDRIEQENSRALAKMG